MEFELLGWPEDGPTLRLDYERFSYAGKFVMSNTGKAVFRVSDESDESAGAGENGARASRDDTGASGDQAGTFGDQAGAGTDADAEFDTDVLAAVAFNEDRTDPDALWLRYVTVRDDLRGDALGPRLAAEVTARAAERGYDRVKIAVNNPYAYRALWKAGFAYTGERTGIAELVLAAPRAAARSEGGRSLADLYRAGFERFRGRENLSDAERSYVERRIDGDPPEPIDAARAFD